MSNVIEKTFAETFKDLKVYQLSFETALLIHKASLTFPKHEQYALADQMRRASKSICANIAEGFGKQAQSKAEFKRFLSIAKGSADEMQVWLDFAKELEYVTAENHKEYIAAYNHIARMLQKLIQSHNT